VAVVIEDGKEGAEEDEFAESETVVGMISDPDGVVGPG
jgi:hypothetical protein